MFWEFTIVEPGDWFETKLFRAFRAGKVIGRPAKGGKFALTAGGDMYKTIVRLLDVKQRKDRVSLRPLRHMLFKVRVRTVRVDSKQVLLPEHMQYSVVDAVERHG